MVRWSTGRSAEACSCRGWGTFWTARDARTELKRLHLRLRNQHVCSKLQIKSTLFLNLLESKPSLQCTCGDINLFCCALVHVNLRTSRCALCEGAAVTHSLVDMRPPVGGKGGGHKLQMCVPNMQPASQSRPKPMLCTTSELGDFVGQFCSSLFLRHVARFSRQHTVPNLPTLRSSLRTYCILYLYLESDSSLWPCFYCDRASMTQQAEDFQISPAVHDLSRDILASC